MDKEREKKNPFFLPALIMTLIPVVIFVCYYADIARYFPDAMAHLLLFLMFTAPFAAIFLSVAGLYAAGKLQEPFIGCVCCLILVFLEILGFLSYLSRPIGYPEPQIMTRNLTPEESASDWSLSLELKKHVTCVITVRALIML